jgi:hypothetical protein
MPISVDEGPLIKPNHHEKGTQRHGSYKTKMAELPKDEPEIYPAKAVDISRNVCLSKESPLIWTVIADV